MPLRPRPPGPGRITVRRGPGRTPAPRHLGPDTVAPAETARYYPRRVEDSHLTLAEPAAEARGTRPAPHRPHAPAHITPSTRRPPLSSEPHRPRGVPAGVGEN